MLSEGSAISSVNNTGAGPTFEFLLGQFEITGSSPAAGHSVQALVVISRRDCHCAAPPLTSVGISIGMERGCQQNDSLADG